MATKKHRLSNLLGSKKEAGSPPQPQETIQHKQSSETNGTTQPDSAYASSENSRDREMQHIDSNNDDGRNLAVDKKTGEVLDEDTGEVVTTVTTTTTTTTVTRTGGKGKGTQVEVTTQPGGGGSTSQTHSPSHSPVPAGIAEAPGDSPSTPRQPPTHGQHLSPADAAQPQQQQSPASCTSSPAVETQHVYPKAEPQATHPALRQDQPQQQQRQQQQPQPQHPQIPPRQPHRKSTDRPPPHYTDTNGYKDMPASPSTAHNNFSYPNPTRSQERLHRPSNQPPPSSSPETMHPGYHPHPHHPSTGGAGDEGGGGNTLHSLKSAAIGLHGVGETLRGTLNSEVDNRLQRRNPTKNSAAREKNAQVMQRGEREMAGLREGRGLGTTVAPAGGSSGGGGMGGEEGLDGGRAGYVRGGGVQQNPQQRQRGPSYGQQQAPPMPKRFYGEEESSGQGGDEGGQQQQQRRRERSSSRVQALSQTNGGVGGGGSGAGSGAGEQREKEKEGRGGGLRKFLKGR
ncbi:hypothetical protein D0868_02067 [Hortaea werneckii]|uniref:Uncharacterized protein n=1 Tax=Hortaea werneckii TaxID=91943 RepID=A0A3M6ZDI3_HORWE|nr:hypothetical protein D0868_02067 [Hortaea werneckii]